jgi:organic radical activating enzyme
MRERPEALTALASSSKVSFKWVVTSDKDLEEIETLISKYGMKENYLMPEGKTRVEQLARQDKVKKLCEEKGFKFSPRLHVLENDVKRRI